MADSRKQQQTDDRTAKRALKVRAFEIEQDEHEAEIYEADPTGGQPSEY